VDSIFRSTWSSAPAIEQVKRKQRNIETLTEEAMKRAEERLSFLQSKPTSASEKEARVGEEWASLLPRILDPVVILFSDSAMAKTLDDGSDRS
jgi:hypothetical protein